MKMRNRRRKLWINGPPEYMEFPQVLGLFTLSGHAKGQQRTMRIKGWHGLLRGSDSFLSSPKIWHLSKWLFGLPTAVVRKGTPLDGLLLILRQGSEIGR